MGKFKTITGFVAAVVLLGATQSFAAGGAALEHADIEPGNIASLQRGARNYMNYCSGCHSAQYVRFSTIGRDLELSDEQLSENLMFNADKTFETIAAQGYAGVELWFPRYPEAAELLRLTDKAGLQIVSACASVAAGASVSTAAQASEMKGR